MPWAPTVAGELRNDVRFALGWKDREEATPHHGRGTRHGRSDRRAHPAVQLARRARAAAGPGFAELGRGSPGRCDAVRVPGPGSGDADQSALLDPCFSLISMAEHRSCMAEARRGQP